MNTPNTNLTPQALINELDIDSEQLNNIVQVCQLQEKDEYTAPEVELIRRYYYLILVDPNNIEELSQIFHTCFSQSQSVETALDHLEAHLNNQNTETEAVSTSRQWVNEPVSLLALLGLAEDLTSKPMTLSRGLEILEACGLKEQPQYQPDMANRFLDAVDRVTNLGESLGAIATENGVTQGASGMDWLQTASKVDAQQIAGLMQDEGTQTAVELTTTYRQMVLSKVRDSFVNGQVNQAYVEGQQQLLGDNARWDAVREQLRKDREAMGLGGRSYVIDVTPTESLSSQNQAQLPQGEQEG